MMAFITFMTSMTHWNVIFDILEPAAFRKYSTWWQCPHRGDTLLKGASLNTRAPEGANKLCMVFGLLNSRPDQSFRKLEPDLHVIWEMSRAGLKWGYKRNPFCNRPNVQTYLTHQLFTWSYLYHFRQWLFDSPWCGAFDDTCVCIFNEWRTDLRWELALSSHQFIPRSIKLSSGQYYLKWEGRI